MKVILDLGDLNLSGEIPMLLSKDGLITFHFGEQIGVVKKFVEQHVDLEKCHI